MPSTDSPHPAGPALAAVAGAAALFGLTGTIAELGPDDLAPFAAGVWRSMIGGAALVAIAWALGSPVWRYRRRLGWTLLGGVGVAAYQLAFFEAVDRTGVALGTLITIGGGPPVAGLLDAAIHRRRPSGRWLAGSAIAIAGVAALSGGTDDADAVGIALALVAAASFPLFGTAAQQLMVDRPFLPAMATVFGAGMVLLLPVAVTTTGEAFDTAGSLATVGALGLVTLTAAYVLWGIGLRGLSLSVVVTATLLEPAVASTLAVVVLDEPFTAVLAIGLLLVALGVWVSARPGRATEVSAASA